MKNNRWIGKVLVMTPLLILHGCGPSGGGSNEAPRILDVHTVVHTYGDHEAESNMTMTAYFQVEDENGIDDIDHARMTFPDGSWYQLSAHNRLFERNGEHYMRGHFFMPSTGDTEEKSFAMHGYKVEVVDKLSASKTQIFSIAEEGGDLPPSNSRIVHPDDYTASLTNAYPALEEPVIHDVIVFNDGVQVEVDITDSRAGELQVYFADAEGEWFANHLEVDASELTIPGTCTYSILLEDFNIDDGFSLSDIEEASVSTYDPGRLDEGPFTFWSFLSSSAITSVINQDTGTVPEDSCGEAS